MRGMRLIKIRKRYKKESMGLGINLCVDVGVIWFVGIQKLLIWKLLKGMLFCVKVMGFYNWLSWVICDRIL